MSLVMLEDKKCLKGVQQVLEKRLKAVLTQKIVFEHMY